MMPSRTLHGHNNFLHPIPVSGIKGRERIALNKPVCDDEIIHSQWDTYYCQIIF